MLLGKTKALPRPFVLKHGLDSRRQIGDRILAVLRQNLSRKIEGFGEIAIGQRRDHRALGKVLVVRIDAQRLTKEGRGRERVALLIGDDRREDVARETLADLEGSRDREMLTRLVRSGDGAEVENANRAGKLRRDAKIAADRCRLERRESHVRGFRLRRMAGKPWSSASP